MILNDLPWKQTDHSVIFEIASKYCISDVCGCESWDYKESRMPKNYCFWTVVLEKTLKSPFDCKEIKPVNPEGNQPWIFIGGTDAETPILWPHDVKSHSLEKTPLLGKIEGRKRIRWQRMSWLDGITDSGHEMVSDSSLCAAWCAAVHRISKSQTPLSDWTITTRKDTRRSMQSILKELKPE